MRLELIIIRNGIGEEIKLITSEKNSIIECTKELLSTLNEIQPKLKGKKIGRMIQALEPILQ